MCGIAGFIGQGDQRDLEQMTRALIHRGPDGEGFKIFPNHGVHLGHRRLSVSSATPEITRPPLHHFEAVSTRPRDHAALYGIVSGRFLHPRHTGEGRGEQALKRAWLPRPHPSACSVK